jgi:hypothetical protein
LRKTLTGPGSGLDFVWAKRLRYQRSVVIDDAAVPHARPVASTYIERSKQYYKILKSFSGFLSDERENKEGDDTFLCRLFHGYGVYSRRRPEALPEKLQLKPFNPR